VTGHKAAGFRKLQKAGFNRLFLRFFVTLSFYTFVYFAKSSHNEDGSKKLQSTSLSGLFVTVCDDFTSILI
jgi:hypothetical protein